jgi:hypothetical protein
MHAVSSSLAALARCAYVFVLVDQWPDGLWGRSLSVAGKKEWSSRAEATAAEQLGKSISLSVSYYAVDAIRSYAGDSRHPAIEAAVAALKHHRRSSGAYGSYRLSIESQYGLEQRIHTSCRHTASALLLLLASGVFEAARIAESVGFLLAHQRPTGGWGVEADPTAEDADYPSTAAVLQVLSVVRRHSEIMDHVDAHELDEAIRSGLGWLKRSRDVASTLWPYSPTDSRGRRVLYTSNILSVFSDLTRVDPAIHREAVDRLRSLQATDGGWPEEPEGQSRLSPTIVACNALLLVDCQDDADAIERAISYITASLEHPSVAKHLTTGDWAFLLRAAARANVHVGEAEAGELLKLAHQLRDKLGDPRSLRTLIKAKLPHATAAVDLMSRMPADRDPPHALEQDARRHLGILWRELGWSVRLMIGAVITAVVTLTIIWLRDTFF